MHDKAIEEICNATAKVADILKDVKSKGGTTGDALTQMVQSFMAPNDPERIFFEWLTENRARLKEACGELGVELPAEGKDFYRRLKAAVLSALRM